MFKNQNPKDVLDILDPLVPTSDVMFELKNTEPNVLKEVMMDTIKDGITGRQEDLLNSILVRTKC